MKASVKWLREFVEFSLTASELANALTMAGLEVEDINELEEDAILEINITPNRSDCLSITGIAREISALLGMPFKFNPASVQKEEGAGPSIEIKDESLCPRYASRVIYNVQVKPSPQWISERLQHHGLRPVNNIVDITNYVLLEMGHPLHAFDLDRLSGKRIVVKTAGSADRLLTLDNEDRKLTREMLLIWDSEKPVAVAGVMGGLHTEVIDSTKHILLESAYFSPLSIRRTSKALSLSTEASYRFERGADINGVVPALERAVQLIIDNAGGTATGITDVYRKPLRSQRITLTWKKINDTLGININPSRIYTMLKSLGIEHKTEGEGISVMPPSFRQDMRMDVDVIEEVARLYGYNNIPSTFPNIEIQPIKSNIRWDFVHTIKNLMVRSGYLEAINYSFLNPSVFDKLRLPAKDKRRKLTTIKNPLKKEDEALRTTLIPALLENVRLNIRRGERSIRIFEISSVFLHSTRNLPYEILKLSAIYLKDRNETVWQEKHDGFYDLKGALENIFLDLKIKDYSFHKDMDVKEPYLHPGKSCVIKINEHVAGYLGTLHPEVAEDFDVYPETNIMELDIDKILSLKRPQTVYQPLPKYPYIERDIAIIVPNNIPVSDAESAILHVDSHFIESVRLFDIYEGKPIPKGKKSLAFSIRYRAVDRTLTDEEVKGIHTNIIKRLQDTLNAELRS
jgi:phenylalanyl-tRNA synthetase beta chain